MTPLESFRVWLTSQLVAAKGQHDLTRSERQRQHLWGSYLLLQGILEEFDHRTLAADPPAPPVLREQIDLAIATAIGDGASLDARDAIQAAREAVTEVWLGVNDVSLHDAQVPRLRPDEVPKHQHLPQSEVSTSQKEITDPPAPPAVPAEALQDRELLKALVMGWDSEDSSEFLGAVVKARDYLGLKLADEDEDRLDREVLAALGHAAPPAPRLLIQRWRARADDMERASDGETWTQEIDEIRKCANELAAALPSVEAHGAKET